MAVLRLGSLATLAWLLLAMSAHASADDRNCDRACLEGKVDLYLDALLARDPEQLPLARNVRFTENGQALRLGEALWGGVTAVRDYRLIVADPQAGQVALLGVLEEHGLPVLFSLRLEVEARRITEVETVAVRQSGLFGPDELTEPRQAFFRTLPEASRASRDELIEITDLYFEGLEQNTGSIVPFGADCHRLENGIATTNNPSISFDGSGSPGRECREQFDSGIFAFITHIDPRRYLVVDEERGLVFGMFMFNHRGDVTHADVPGEGRVALPAAALRPQSVLVAEVFRIADRELQEIEAIMIGLPYGSGTGWD